MNIIDQLISELGVNKEQAEGGAGLVFGVAKEHLDEGDYNQVSNLVPDVDDLIRKAPAPEAEASQEGGVLDAISGVAEAIGLGDVAEKLENLASIVGGFGKLGLDPEMVSKFATAIIKFLQSKGGEQIAVILKSVLK